MSSAKRHNLEFTIDNLLFAEAAKGIIWSIFFQRLFGLVHPESTNFLNISYPRCNIPELDALIDTELQHINSLLEKPHNPETALSTESSYESLQTDILTLRSNDRRRNTLYNTNVRTNTEANTSIPIPAVSNALAAVNDENLNSKIIFVKIKFYKDEKLQLVSNSQTMSQNKQQPYSATADVQTPWNYIRKLRAATTDPETQQGLEELCWEVWTIKFNIFKTTKNQIDNPYLVKIEENFKQVLFKVLEFSTNTVGSIPPVHSNTSYSPFPFDIHIFSYYGKKNMLKTPENNRKNTSNWTSFFKKIIQDQRS